MNSTPDHKTEMAATQVQGQILLQSIIRLREHLLWGWLTLHITNQRQEQKCFILWVRLHVNQKCDCSSQAHTWNSF